MIRLTKAILLMIMTPKFGKGVMKALKALAGVTLISAYAVVFVKVIAGIVTGKFDPWLGIVITSGRDYAVAITSAAIMLPMIGGLVVLICMDIYKSITGKSKKEN